jgi:hypothetical protein
MPERDRSDALSMAAAIPTRVQKQLAGGPPMVPTGSKE